MKIELKSPFKEIWKYGYLRESSIDNRKRVDLFNSNTDRTTISYARYLMSVELGKVLSKDFEVDHIDRDCSNDEITNLQVITLEEHKLKTKQKFQAGNTKTLLVISARRNFKEKLDSQVKIKDTPERFVLGSVLENFMLNLGRRNYAASSSNRY